jgi:PIN domain nuclease of toxin-antitoxin system
MRLLLDAHVVLWWLSDAPTLSDDVKDMIDDEIDVFVSAATVWELAIKQARGKIKAPVEVGELIRDSDLRELRIGFEHAITAAQLPEFHRDPFDRMLIAQARHEGLTLITRDPDIARYDVAILRA